MFTRFSRHATLLTADEYANDLTRAIKHAHDRVVLMATTLRDDDARSHRIVEALIAAANRGVEISVCADTFTYLEPKEFILRRPKRQPARAYRAVQLERRLKRHGISFHWLGRKSNLLVTGRTHSKWSVVDDIVYCFGGVNLDNESFSNTDYMIRIRSPELAEQIVMEQSAIRKADRSGGGRRSHRYMLNEDYTVMFDGGLPGDSIIYRRACRLAREATDIVLVSQYCPTGPLNRILKHKHARSYFNHWRHASSVNRILISLGMLSAQQQTHYAKDSYLHAKFIIYTMPDGTKTALTGSHNFMFSSGITGTREVALETSDPYIIKQLEQFRKKHVE